ncbi:MAG: hypothetical protein RLZZ118_2 [Bacteroidota bacterium]|jgi:uncharacterized protein (TIGR00730 family)
MKRITVFCGSSNGTKKEYREQAYYLGKTLAIKNIGLVYGGARIGLMGAVADGALANGGEVIGVIPDFLQTKEIAHDSLSQLIVTATMHERKTKMNELCDGVIALPGGFGTIEELFEMLTWAQLALHQKPIGILNTDGYFNHLIAFVQHQLDEQFIKPFHQHLLIVGNTVDDLLEKMKLINDNIERNEITLE